MVAYQMIFGKFSRGNIVGVHEVSIQRKYSLKESRGAQMIEEDENNGVSLTDTRGSKTGLK